MDEPKAKRVELSELFYDLVFVYAISCSTALIHHLHGGVVDPMALLSFAVVFIVLVNSWMIETVFTNRFGGNTWRDVGFMFASMVLVLLMSANLGTDITASLRPFSAVVGLWTLLLLAQYVVRYLGTSDAKERAFMRLFFVVLGLRAAFMFAAVAFDHPAALALMLCGVASGWILPGLFSGRMRDVPINFPHLTERLSLLVIITLGEAIVGIAPYFVLEQFSVVSVFAFLAVAALFVAYVMEFDQLVDRTRPGITGNGMIYLHYPILFGISAVTVGLAFLADPSANRLFTVAWLYAGIGLYMVGIFLATRYNRQQARLGAGDLRVFGIIFAVGLVASLALAPWQPAVTCIASATLVAQAVYLVFLRQRVDIGV